MKTIIRYILRVLFLLLFILGLLVFLPILWICKGLHWVIDNILFILVYPCFKVTNYDTKKITESPLYSFWVDIVSLIGLFPLTLFDFLVRYTKLVITYILQYILILSGDRFRETVNRKITKLKEVTI